MTNTHDEYLGDGVYASWDGFHVWLDLRGQDDTTRIGIDPNVRQRLKDYIALMDYLEWERHKQEHTQ